MAINDFTNQNIKDTEKVISGVLKKLQKEK